MGQAAGAFLTTALEDRLESFNQFLSASIAATAVQRRAVVKVGVYGVSRQWEGVTHRNVSQLSLQLPGLEVSVREVEVLSAPLHGTDFESRFVTDTTQLRALIKEVTLGAHATAGG